MGTGGRVINSILPYCPKSTTLNERLPTVEDISIGEVEIYSEHMPLQTEPSALLEVKVITQTGGMSQTWQGESR